jgi:hypothetical protein
LLLPLVMQVGPVAQQQQQLVSVSWLQLAAPSSAAPEREPGLEPGPELEPRVPALAWRPPHAPTLPQLLPPPPSTQKAVAGGRDRQALCRPAKTAAFEFS